MELVRISRNAWGQTELLGASWEPLWLFVAAGIAAIVLHALFVAATRRRRRGDEVPRDRAAGE
ncbi:MAG TPA: hypothetical protein ENO23_03600 [Alphaproteobacteria bacterium]|nr:hypothetical protein [Alphaproteobacteria bacterium]